MVNTPHVPFEPSVQREALQFLGDWLRWRDLSQRQLAELVGVSEPTVSKWLSGKQSMTIGHLYVVARVLNAAPEELLAAPPSSNPINDRMRNLSRLVARMSDTELDGFIAIATMMTAGKAA